MSWDEFGFVSASKYRKKIVKTLNKGPKTPKQIADDINLRMTHVSRALKELTQTGIAICLTPKRNKGKIYGLTEKGQKIFSLFQQP